MFNDKILKSVAEAVKAVVDEALKGDQHKIDKNKNGKIDKQDPVYSSLSPSIFASFDQNNDGLDVNEYINSQFGFHHNILSSKDRQKAFVQYGNAVYKTKKAEIEKPQNTEQIEKYLSSKLGKKVVLLDSRFGEIFSIK
jgi:hypothetical protein